MTRRSVSDDGKVVIDVAKVAARLAPIAALARNVAFPGLLNRASRLRGLAGSGRQADQEFRSPASIAAGSRFSRGARGQVQTSA